MVPNAGLHKILRQRQDEETRSLDALASRSQQALQAASTQAGEPVVWCCGHLRRRGLIDYKCSCEWRSEERETA